MPDRPPIPQALDDAIALATWLRDTERDSGAIATIASHLAGVLKAGGRVLTCGNGGSLCDAMHFAEEMSGRFRGDRPALAVQAMAAMAPEARSASRSQVASAMASSSPWSTGVRSATD